jgi:microcompartment protein CcmL/EutN
VKAADVVLAELRLAVGIGGKSYAILTGEVAAVQEAINCGVNAEQCLGMALAHVVIPRPGREVFESLW